MGLSFEQFLLWIRKTRMYKSGTKLKRIDYELAIRIGEALGMNPIYWVNLQLEHDIQLHENKVGEGYVQLNHSLRHYK